MADMPFFPGGGSGGGSQGTTNYDILTNKPVTNVIGSPVVISNLATGIYNIEGTWAMTSDSTPIETLNDDLFYVRNDGGICKLTWITAGEINTYSVPEGGTAEDVTWDSVPTTDKIAENLVGGF